MSQYKSQIQNHFLSQARKKHLPVEVVLNTGITLRGKIKGYDQFSVSLIFKEKVEVIYKSSILYISQLPRRLREPRRFDDNAERPPRGEFTPRSDSPPRGDFTPRSDSPPRSDFTPRPAPRPRVLPDFNEADETPKRPPRMVIEDDFVPKKTTRPAPAKMVIEDDAPPPKKKMIIDDDPPPPKKRPSRT
jgi:host factor-I protein